MKNYLLLIFLFCTLASSAQYINRYAGCGPVGYNGDNINARAAYLNYPHGIAIDKYRNLYIADSWNNRIRKVDTFGIITTIAGTGVAGLSGDGGHATDAKLDHPGPICIDFNLNIYFSDGNNDRIRKIDNSGMITNFAGSVMGYSGDGGLAVNAKIYAPYGICLDRNMNIYFSDVGNNVIRKIDSSGIISTIAGNDTMGYSGSGGLATNASINPSFLNIDRYNNIYICEGFTNRIRKVDASGFISVFAGSGPIDTGDFSGDGGPATNARLNYPGGMDFDKYGNMYFVDQYNHRIRKVDTNGIINTFAGAGPVGIGAGGYWGDEGLAIVAGFDHPRNLKIKDSTIFVIDFGNDIIRRIDYSLWIAVQVPFVTDSISLYPNPVSSSNILRIDHSNVYDEYAFYSITGVVMQSGIITTDNNLKIDLPPGNYVLKLTNAITGNHELKIITVL